MQSSVPFDPRDIQEKSGQDVYHESFVVRNEAAFWLEKTAGEKRLCVAAPLDSPLLNAFRGKREPFGNGRALKRCPVSLANGRALRDALPWLKPVPLGLNTSAGLGDRLGLATPGHARAITGLPANKIAPVFAQQSIREMERSARSPGDVVNDATWGAFQAGWKGKLGADADHLKTPADIDLCAEAGFTLFTIDPGAHVDNEADRAGPGAIAAKLAALPWQELESSASDTELQYAGKKFDFEPNPPFENRTLVMNKEDVMRAAAKYGAAVAHVTQMARRLEAAAIPRELEISVDETETPTSFPEHIYIAGELKRLGVKWVSLAPRYVGRFEKGIDYIGDRESLVRHLAGHAAIARAMGPYKLSLHSGSDKFGIYQHMSNACGSLVHLKTAGTSYVEALRVLARVEAKLFREIGRLAVERYPEDKATYHVSADPGMVPDFSAVPDSQLAGLLDEVNVRQVLHVTFGSVMKIFGARLKAALQANEDAYYETLERHFRRHLEPFLERACAT